MVYRKNKSTDEFKDLWVDKLTKITIKQVDEERPDLVG